MPACRGWHRSNPHRRSGPQRQSSQGLLATGRMRHTGRTGPGMTRDHRERLQTGGCRWRSEPAFGVAPRADPPAALSFVGDSRFKRHHSIIGHCAVNQQHRFRKCGSVCQSRGTPVLNKARHSPVAVEKPSPRTPPDGHHGTHRRSPSPDVENRTTRKWLAILGKIRRLTADTRIAPTLTNGAIYLEAKGFGSSCRTRTHNPPLNSRKRPSHLTSEGFVGKAPTPPTDFFAASDLDYVHSPNFPTTKSAARGSAILYAASNVYSAADRWNGPFAAMAHQPNFASRDPWRLDRVELRLGSGFSAAWPPRPFPNRPIYANLDTWGFDWRSITGRAGIRKAPSPN